MAEQFEVPPERLGRWIERWAQANGPVASTALRAERVVVLAERGSLEAEPPFPPLAGTGLLSGLAVDDLLEHAGRERRVGVLLARRGGHACGVFAGDRLVASKVGSRHVKGRTKKGGSSSGRYARRRGEQAREAAEAGAEVAARILLPQWRTLDAVVLGGDRAHVAAVLDAEPRLAVLRPLVVRRFLGVPDPRQAVLEQTPAQFRATVLRPRGPAPP